MPTLVKSDLTTALVNLTSTTSTIRQGLAPSFPAGAKSSRWLFVWAASRQNSDGGCRRCNISLLDDDDDDDGKRKRIVNECAKSQHPQRASKLVPTSASEIRGLEEGKT
ncbi:uncharacterized protein N7482_003978 [Penicillium canariense]|uniref:Uncharacterized protein n=1 Tax=Penicillium canariense TaxID=189055 RepID=A0A9W9LNY5_9EURO|nr:uncharacterized protein N7482_003978 [Penicillium canariense]KAJ5168384.1 hypothetical protein N7482_003978 [Penicillium canariense]